jgi:ABC-2 type transport system permease protein
VFGLVGNMFMHVREGTFDLVLIKPRSALFLSIATAIDTEDLGKLLGGIGMFLVLIWHLPPIGFTQWLQCSVLFLLALSVIFSFALIMSGTLFVWVGNGRVWEIFETITMFGLYPRSIFSKGLQTFLTAVIPIAMIAFFPASILLGKPHEGVIISAVVCLVFLGLSVKFWHLMMSKYTSAGG